MPRDRAELEELLNRSTAPLQSEHPAESAARLNQVQIEAPRYVVAMLEIRTAIRRYRNFMKLCKDPECDATCIRKEPHRAEIVEANLDEPLREAEGAISKLYEATVEMMVAYEECTCPFCAAAEEDEDEEGHPLF